jgi:hypothetical protein
MTMRESNQVVALFFVDEMSGGFPTTKYDAPLPDGAASCIDGGRPSDAAKEAFDVGILSRLNRTMTFGASSASLCSRGSPRLLTTPSPARIVKI